MTQITYQGFTQKDLIKKFIYNPSSGEFTNRKTGQVITTTKGGRLVIGLRQGNKVLTLSPARLAFMIMENRSLSKDEMIKFLDGDPNNTRFNNLSIVLKKCNVKTKDKVDWYTTKTDCDGIILLHPSKVFVVRRGNKQAVYRTKDYDHALEVYNEWLMDKSIHRWDNTIPDVYMPQNGLR